MPTFATLLSLSGQGVAPYSARGLTQTLEPIDLAAQLKRTVNGDLKDISFDGFKKYKSAINCSDQKTPALDGVWPGVLLTVDCVSELSYKTTGGSPARPVVPDSSYEDGEYTYYRPRLDMRVTSYTASRDEWQHVVGWTLLLEEV